MSAPATAPAGHGGSGNVSGTAVLAITGWGVVSPLGTGAAAFTSGLAAGGPGPADVSEMFEEELPRPDGFAVTDFSAKDHLGRKGTSFLDRSTALALVACGQAIADAGLVVDETNTQRVGIALGTTAGSVKSTSDYSRATYVEDKPYLVNPLIFPNAVMNASAGQAAIRYKMRGVNATVAGGQVAALSALRYARGQIALGRVDVLLVGATEEYCPQSAWATEFAMREHGGTLAAGEGAAVFVVEDAERVRAEGRQPDAEVLAIEVGTHLPEDETTPGSDFSPTLARVITRAVERAGVRPEDVWAVASAENGMPVRDGYEDAAITTVLGTGPERIRVKALAGEAASASNALQFAAVLARHRGDAALDGRVSVVTSRTPDGVVGAAVLRGWRGRDRDAC
ncbi:beta-ketoacyl synthase [Actinokineospora sp. PR83]|uniref:beta-ketoacyl synthase N-terminal-like domain-containing protein n=1 Tax=Actinokineospora sp. PR83 TaxID=2884908 RepID=UPI001F3E166F|nr:beta-ketoacyl synthase N-terminal-like domain-containing protein [Actinokineospora sp. PR83]MCG8914800.1 beta-ketoacyl synthase [Actinokineospora sp. PR83]